MPPSQELEAALAKLSAKAAEVSMAAEQTASLAQAAHQLARQEAMMARLVIREVDMPWYTCTVCRMSHGTHASVKCPAHSSFTSLDDFRCTTSSSWHFSIYYDTAAIADDTADSISDISAADDSAAIADSISDLSRRSTSAADDTAAIADSISDLSSTSAIADFITEGPSGVSDGFTLIVGIT